MPAEPFSAFTDAVEPNRTTGRVASHPTSPEMRDVAAAEFEHRFRNLLRVVSAITRQTLRSFNRDSDRPIVRSARIAALAYANDLVQLEPTVGFGIGDVGDAALAPLGGNSSGQFTGGGPDMRLDGGLAVALILVLHELATNALKHGALSVEGGRVSVRWAFTDQAEDEFAFHWVEGAGPEVQPPSRESFGLQMIRQALAPYVQTMPELRYRAEGVVFAFKAEVPWGRPARPSHGRSRPRGFSADHVDGH